MTQSKQASNPKTISCPICKGSGWDTRTDPKQVCDCVIKCGAWIPLVLTMGRKRAFSPSFVLRYMV